jgi:hypothetical protein
MNIVPMPITNLKDIAQQLRKMADFVEQSDEHLSCVLILGRADCSVDVCGWGHRVSGLEMQGWIARAAVEVAAAVRSYQEAHP